MSITYPAETLRPVSFLNPLEHEKPQVHFNARSTHVKPLITVTSNKRNEGELNKKHSTTGIMKDAVCT